MKFENPIMNISMFEVENVVTEASGVVPAPTTIDDAARNSGYYQDGKTITVNFADGVDMGS